MLVVMEAARLVWFVGQVRNTHEHVNSNFIHTEI